MKYTLIIRGLRLKSIKNEMIEKSKQNSRDQWFHGSLDRKGADKLLNLYPPGSFLVRQTGDNSGNFSSGFCNLTGSLNPFKKNRQVAEPRF